MTRTITTATKRRATRKPPAAWSDTPPEFREGDTVLFTYPKFPFVKIVGPLEPQLLTVVRIRDLWADPLDPAVIEAQPLLHRGRYLVIGIHADNGARGEFYFDRMRNVATVEIPDNAVIHTEQLPGAECFSVWTVERSRYLTRSEADAAAETLRGLTGRTAPVQEIRVPIDAPRSTAGG